MQPPMTNRTLDIGSRYSPDSVCTPFKSTLGSMIDALEAGADTLIMTLGLCRLGYYGELQEKIDAFRNGEYDIMLGTQMVAKGLNFPNLQLVGVILADTGLHLPDFRAAERTFALITQVAGRAGRYFPDGKVIVQSYNPLREPVRFACENNINAFYSYELQQRKILGFPPFSRLVRLVFRSSFQNQAFFQAEDGIRD